MFVFLTLAFSRTIDVILVCVQDNGRTARLISIIITIGFFMVWGLQLYTGG